MIHAQIFPFSKFSFLALPGAVAWPRGRVLTISIWFWFEREDRDEQIELRKPEERLLRECQNGQGEELRD